jgi:hypothetical protein
MGWFGRKSDDEQIREALARCAAREREREEERALRQLEREREKEE